MFEQKLILTHLIFQIFYFQFTVKLPNHATQD